MDEPTKPSSDGNGAHGESKREAAQATLSAIGDVSVAATNALGRVAAGPRKTRWLPIAGFLVVVYILGSVAAIYAHPSAPWVQVFVAPLAVVVIAVVTFWRRQEWKFRASDWRFKAKVREDTLNSLAHETANGLNAIRANLAGFEDADSLPSAAEHLKQVDRSLGRIAAAVDKAVGQNSYVPTSKAGGEASKSKAA